MILCDFGAREMGMGRFGTKAVLMRIRNLVSFGVCWESGKQGDLKGPYILGFGSGAVRKSLEPCIVGPLIVDTIGLEFPS